MTRALEDVIRFVLAVAAAIPAGLAFAVTLACLYGLMGWEIDVPTHHASVIGVTMGIFVARFVMFHRQISGEQS